MVNRDGTITFCAALKVLTREEIEKCMPKHRNIDFLRFLPWINQEVPKGLQIHFILDNYGTHERPNV